MDRRRRTRLQSPTALAARHLARGAPRWLGGDARRNRAYADDGSATDQPAAQARSATAWAALAALTASATLVTACGAVSSPSAAAAPSFDHGLAAERPLFADGLWDDGQAEIAVYDAVERRYGSFRDGQLVLITVTEPFDTDALVKIEQDQRPDHRMTVLKLNTVLTMPTGVYTYHQMSSAFLTRDTLRPLKLTVSSQEWCGITSKVLTVRGREALLRTFSYFGDENERVFHVAIDPDVVLADALPVWVRSLDLERSGERSIAIVDRQLDNRGRPPEIRRATVTVGPRAPIEVPAGNLDATEISVITDSNTDVFYVHSEPPHELLRWQRADGGHYALRMVRRAPYWQMNGVEHVGALDRLPGLGVPTADNDPGATPSVPGPGGDDPDGSPPSRAQAVAPGAAVPRAPSPAVDDPAAD